VGRPLDAVARERGATPLDVLCDLAIADALETRFDVTFANDDVADVSRLLTAEGAIMGLSDAGAHVNQICDAVMPTDFLSSWVRDRELMSVERGLHKLTGELAGVLGLERGVLAPGAPADVVVLDWEALSPGPIRRVADLPAGGERLVADAPTGIDHVLVNGIPIRTNGAPALDTPEHLPGTILRST
jgi:N-acyl-D-aspartate/D-glutamate deacylase